MGLAASQARMLFLTARKNDIEFNQMRLANDKITMSRESEAVADDYNRALQQRKLAWAVDGGVLSTTVTDLTYELVATKNDTNTLGQFIFSDMYGRVVLSDAYKNKIFGGTSDTSGTIGTLTRNQFLDKFGIVGANFDDPYLNVTQNGQIAAPAGYAPKSSMTDNSANLLITAISDYKAAVTGSGRKSDTTTVAYNKAALLLNNAISSVGVKIAELENAATPPAAGTKGAIDLAQYKKELTALNKQLVLIQTAQDININGMSPSPVMDGGQSDETEAVEDFTRKMIQTLVTGTSGLQSGEYDAFYDKWKTPYSNNENARQMNIAFQNKNIGISVKLDGHADGLSIGLNTGTYTITNNEGNPTLLLTTARTGATAVDDTPKVTPERAKADYYTNLYYAIKSKGWVCDSSATDKSALNNKLLNGSYNIEEVDDGGVWSPLSSGDPTSPVRNLRDDDAIAAAETKYDSEKAKIETKENQLDLQMKNLDTERTEADTEIDSVKSIISKNVERSFKMFA